MDFARPATPRPRVTVTEVGTRDGLQSEAKIVPPDVKAGLIDALIGIIDLRKLQWNHPPPQGQPARDGGGRRESDNCDKADERERADKRSGRCRWILPMGFHRI